MSHDLLAAEEVVSAEALSTIAEVDAAPAPGPAEATTEVPAADVAGAVAAIPQTAAPVDQRAALLAAVRSARDLPPGVRERLTSLVQEAVTLDRTGDPLLSTRQVLELLAQGLPPLLRRETSTAVDRPVHPVGDAFFAANSEELSDQQAEQIARQQLQRAGLLRAA